jgi:hypothetical protein
MVDFRSDSFAAIVLTVPTGFGASRATSAPKAPAAQPLRRECVNDVAASKWSDFHSEPPSAYSCGALVRILPRREHSVMLGYRIMQLVLPAR